MALRNIKVPKDDKVGKDKMHVETGRYKSTRKTLRPHNPKVVGSNPAPASTKWLAERLAICFFGIGLFDRLIG
jgi:hypothetical protein